MYTMSVGVEDPLYTQMRSMNTRDLVTLANMTQFGNTRPLCESCRHDHLAHVPHLYCSWACSRAPHPEAIKIAEGYAKDILVGRKYLLTEGAGGSTALQTPGNLMSATGEAAAKQNAPDSYGHR